ncbi:MAG TPA: low-specificity L-threonine aldolase [Tissierellia bacterium]|nr:low-specificity L-threonine aldolase [Tissierellia bacterium]
MDFRSDTVTKPTERMRQAMLEALVGDDVYGDDPTVNRLEAMMAEMMGKAAGLFVPSGHFSNQCAIMTHTRRGDEIIVLEDCHIVLHECGAPGLLSGVNTRLARSDLGEYDVEEVKRLIRGDDIHEPRTALICLENAHGNGRAIPLVAMKEIWELAKEYDIPVHLDGARIFNAATALECNVRDIARYADSVSICLSKGLSAPIGSVLVGSADFIARARRNRKIMGGGMRQVGVIAAAGIVALEDMVDRLDDDHILANYLGIQLDDIGGIQVAWDRLDINMVFFTLEQDIDLAAKLEDADILINGAEFGEYRIVINKDVNKEDVDRLIIAIREILGAA